MNIKVNRKLLAVILISVITCLIGFYIHEFLDLDDCVYTSLYYVPVVMAGLWYYRCVIPLALTFAVYYSILDFTGPDGLSVDQIVRGLIMILVAVILFYLGKKLSKENQELKTSRNLLAIEKERLKIMLLSIGDGVISVDINGNVTFLNEAAKRLSGWLDESAIDRPFTEVFKIINEYTREKSEDLIKKVLETGQVIELANHTALIAKDGTERSIAGASMLRM